MKNAVNCENVLNREIWVRTVIVNIDTQTIHQQIVIVQNGIDKSICGMVQFGWCILE